MIDLGKKGKETADSQIRKDSSVVNFLSEELQVAMLIVILMNSFFLSFGS